MYPPQFDYFLFFRQKFINLVIKKNVINKMYLLFYWLDWQIYIV